jgi:hypothetical protein
MNQVPPGAVDGKEYRDAFELAERRNILLSERTREYFTQFLKDIYKRQNQFLKSLPGLDEEIELSQEDMIRDYEEQEELELLGVVQGEAFPDETKYSFALKRDIMYGSLAHLVMTPNDIRECIKLDHSTLMLDLLDQIEPRMSRAHKKAGRVVVFDTEYRALCSSLRMDGESMAKLSMILRDYAINKFDINNLTKRIRMKVESYDAASMHNRGISEEISANLLNERLALYWFTLARKKRDELEREN